jgi:orotidine-5'-phosphate decarboxylase
VVGIDPVLERLPAALQPDEPTLAGAASALETFGHEVLGAVAGIVPAVKINSAFFEVLHEAGVGAYYRLIAAAHEHGLLVIGDVKRGDIGSTARLYARGHLATPRFTDAGDERMPDAVTVAGYLGESAVRAFAEAAREAGRGLYVLVRPSDPGADVIHEFCPDRRLYEHMADLVHRWGSAANLIGECGLSCVGAVVAPKDPASTAALRARLPHTPWLVPGYGAQGAGAESCRPCFRADGGGAVVNASRSVIYAYEQVSYQQRCGDDWVACIRAAAQDFAADIAPLGPTAGAAATTG